MAELEAVEALELSLENVRKEAAPYNDRLLLYILDMAILHLKKRAAATSARVVFN